jgi:hypothetical protein
MQATNDAQIRLVLLPFVRREHEFPDTFLVEEFALYGGSIRCDIAAFNGVSHGYEIKSHRDTLVRLPNQVEAYSDVFERATLVAPPAHVFAAKKIIPEWWGIIEVKSYSVAEIVLERVRESRPNPAPHGVAIASLLWRPEALRILSNLGLDGGLRSKPMEKLIERLAVELPAERLARYVREALRARGDWRSAARLRRCDVKPQPRANRSDCRCIDFGSNGQ